MPRGLLRRPPAHPAAPVPGTPPSAWTLRQCPRTCLQRSSPCECIPSLGGGKGKEGTEGSSREKPCSSSQWIQASELGIPGPVCRELCNHPAAMAWENQSSWPRMNHHHQQRNETYCVWVGGSVYMSMLAPPCEVTGRTESRRADSSRGRGDWYLGTGQPPATGSAVLHTAGPASRAATGP